MRKNIYLMLAILFVLAFSSVNAQFSNYGVKAALNY